MGHLEAFGRGTSDKHTVLTVTQGVRRKRYCLFQTNKMIVYLLASWGAREVS